MSDEADATLDRDKPTPAPDPEQDFEIDVLVRLRGYGRRKDQTALARSLARSVHYQVSRTAEVYPLGESAEYRTVAVGPLAYDAVLDDGNPGDGYISPLCTCRAETRMSGTLEVPGLWLDPKCPQHGDQGTEPMFGGAGGPLTADEAAAHTSDTAAYDAAHGARYGPENTFGTPAPDMGGPIGEVVTKRREAGALAYMLGDGTTVLTPDGKALLGDNDDPTPDDMHRMEVISLAMPSVSFVFMHDGWRMIDRAADTDVGTMRGPFATAAEMLDALYPPEPPAACYQGHCTITEPVCAMDLAHDDHPSTCHHCGEPL